MSTTEKQTDMLCFYVNGKKVTDQHVDPETTLLSYLRDKLRLTGSKSGCGGGGCGACTVMMSRYDVITKTISHLSVNACLLPVVQLHGAAVTTVEGIGSTKTRIHPVQERIALAHGSQCGFCTPGMVMSVYTLLRNNPHPTMEDITLTLAGNLCRCTGYRPILDGFSTFCQESSSNGNADCCRANGNADCCRANGNADCCRANGNGDSGQANGNADFCQKGTEYNGALDLFDRDGLLPLDETQELIFPPELILMSEAQSQARQEFHADRQEGDRQVHADRQEFHGDRGSWVFPVCVEDLLHLKSTHPEAPLVLGNTNIGPEMKFKGVLHPLIISPIRVKELYDITHTPQGVWVGAGNSLSAMQCILGNVVKSLPDHETELYRALLKHLPSIAGVQIRNVASLGGNIVSAFPNSDLNPLLAAGNCKLKVVSTGGSREVPLNEDFFVGFRKTVLKPEDVVLSVFIPRTRKWEIVRSYRQAPRKENALATVTGAMRVLFGPLSMVTEEISVYYGGVAPTTLRPRMTCDLLTGRRWEEQTFREVYQVLLQDVDLPPGSPGGMETFRTSLTLSLMFSFYLDVLTALKHMGVAVDVSPADCSAIEPLPRTFTPSLQEFQKVPDTQSEQDPVGRPIMHRSAVSQATGEAVYCDDLPHTSGELFMVLVTSTRAHAKIIEVNVTEALRVPGVVDVIRHSDIPGRKVRTMFGYHEDLLAHTQVSCVGQMICAVVADTKAHAKRGAAAVKIRYEDLPNPIFTLEEAIERKSFFEPHRTIERGNVTEAFHTVHHVYEGQIAIGGQEHFYMETQSMLILPVGEDNEFKAYVSTQYPAYTQECIAETLAIPSNRVSVHVKRLGGAFGGKVTKTAILASICSVAAYKTSRPVRCVLERGEDMLITGGRHPVLGKYKVGFMNDGRIQAADIQYFTNAGNTIDESLLVVEKIMLHIDSAYNIPHLRGRGVACRTHLPSNTAFRGFGVPQSIMVLENMITDVAAVLGRPAHEVREVNMYSGPSLTHYKMEFDADNLQKCWSECKVRSDYEARRLATEQFNQRQLWRKRGMAMIPIKYGIAFGESFLNQAAALVHVYKDGSVLVSHGGTEMGQGVHTKMQQVASRELHIPLSKVYISETSTNTVPNTCPSAASFGTDANGMAVKNACETLYQRLEPIRKQKPKGTWESWVDAAFFEKISLSATGFYRGPDCYMNWEQMQGQPYAYFTYGTACCEVELDCLTGDYRTLRTDIVVDIGRSINPSVDIGQIEGAFLQGVGLYTMEELRFSPDGVLLTRGPSQYKIPAVCDAPLSFNVYLLPDVPNPHAIYSSKGIGEPILFLGSAVFYAIKDAVAAARRHSSLIGPFRLDSPATPERTCLACQTPFTQIIPTSRGGCSKPWPLNL